MAELSHKQIDESIRPVSTTEDLKRLLFRTANLQKLTRYGNARLPMYLHTYFCSCITLVYEKPRWKKRLEFSRWINYAGFGNASWKRIAFAIKVLITDDNSQDRDKYSGELKRNAERASNSQEDEILKFKLLILFCWSGLFTLSMRKSLNISNSWEFLQLEKFKEMVKFLND